MDRKIVKTKEFGEIAQQDDGSYVMTDAQLYDQFEKRGLENAKEVIKTVRKVREDFALDAYRFLGQKVKETKEDQYLVAGTSPDRYEFGVLAKKEVNIPSHEGEPVRRETRYGYCTYKKVEKVPDAWKKDGGELAKLSAEIEAMMK